MAEADVPCILDGKYFSVTSRRDGKFPLQLRLNGYLALADRLRRLDGTGFQTLTLKNFFSLKLIPVMFDNRDVVKHVDCAVYFDSVVI